MKFKNISMALTSATGCLLVNSHSHGTASFSEYLGEWDTEVALLVYQEPDRVRAIEPAISAKKTFEDESAISLKLVLDSLTGASHNGASPDINPQTFTRPSGNGSYASEGSESPLDDTFKDTRLNVSAGYLQPVTRFQRVQYGLNVSNEYDFLSVGGSATYLNDLNQRNTTISAGMSFEYDRIRPVGGFPDPLTAMRANNQVQNKTEGTDSKTIAEVLVGVTQVIDRNTLVQLNYGFGQSDGYHTDPYKVVSMVNGSDGTALPTNGLTGTYLFENRPDSRQKQSVFARFKKYVRGNIVDTSYRYMWDDWGVKSHTINLKVRFNRIAGWYVEPLYRYYDQQSADFYRHSITDAEVIPTYLTADYRLGDMVATTMGVKVGWTSLDGNQHSIRLQRYLQEGDSSPADAVGIQRNLDLYPSVEAYILQYNYRY